MIEWEPVNIICPYCGNGGVFRRKDTDKKYDKYIPNYKCFNCYTYFADVNMRKEDEGDGE